MLILCLRAASMLIKAVFLFFSARHLSLEDFGGLTLVNTTISLALAFMGLNFHQYSARLIARQTDSREAVFNHLVFSAIAGLVCYSFLPLVASFAGVRTELLALFFGLLYLEHMCNEAYNLLIPLNRPLAANLLYFTRTACAYVLPMGYIILHPSGADITTVMQIWATSLGALVLVLAVAYWRSLKGELPRLSWTFMSVGFRTCAIYLGVTVLGRMLLTLDKFLVAREHGEAEVGVYSFFFSLAWTIPTLVETAVILPATHEMLNTSRPDMTLLRLASKVILLSVALTAGFFALQGIVLHTLGKEAFEGQIELFYLFAGIGVIYSLCQAVTLLLYSRHRDTTILKAYLSAFITFVLANALRPATTFGVGCTILLAVVVLLLALLAASRKLLSKTA